MNRPLSLDLDLRAKLYGERGLQGLCELLVQYRDRASLLEAEHAELWEAIAFMSEGELPNAWLKCPGCPMLGDAESAVGALSRDVARLEKAIKQMAAQQKHEAFIWAETMDAGYNSDEDDRDCDPHLTQEEWDAITDRYGD